MFGLLKGLFGKKPATEAAALATAAVAMAGKTSIPKIEKEQMDRFIRSKVQPRRSNRRSKRGFILPSGRWISPYAWRLLWRMAAMERDKRAVV